MAIQITRKRSRRRTRTATDRAIDNVFLQHAVGAITTPAAKYKVLDVLKEVRTRSNEPDNIDEIETEINKMFKEFST